MKRILEIFGNKLGRSAERTTSVPPSGSKRLRRAVSILCSLTMLAGLLPPAQIVRADFDGFEFAEPDKYGSVSSMGLHDSGVILPLSNSNRPVTQCPVKPIQIDFKSDFDKWALEPPKAGESPISQSQHDKGPTDRVRYHLNPPPVLNVNPATGIRDPRYSKAIWGPKSGWYTDKVWTGSAWQYATYTGPSDTLATNSGARSAWVSQDGTWINQENDNGYIPNPPGAGKYSMLIGGDSDVFKTDSGIGFATRLVLDVSKLSSDEALRDFELSFWYAATREKLVDGKPVEQDLTWVETEFL